MAKARRFVKLGEKAFGFADPWSKFNIHKGQVKELETVQHRRSQKIKTALQGGHLEKASDKEFENYQKKLTGKVKSTEVAQDVPSLPSMKEDLEEKTKAELTAFYQENYDVNEDDVTTFKKLKHEEMVDELLELAEDD